MFLAFSIFLSYITGTVIFLMVGVFPFAGKMLFGPRDEKVTETVRRSMKTKRTWFVLAIVAVVGYISYILVTQEAMRSAFTLAAVLGVLALFFVFAIFAGTKNFGDDGNDNYG